MCFDNDFTAWRFAMALARSASSAGAPSGMSFLTTLGPISTIALPSIPFINLPIGSRGGFVLVERLATNSVLTISSPGLGWYRSESWACAQRCGERAMRNWRDEVLRKRETCYKNVMTM
jgi:hypothetical protein